MKLDEIIDKNYDCLTSTDQLIVQEIRRDKEEIKNLNSIQTAKRLGISRTSLVRLMKKLGISSYAEFKLILKQEKEDNSHSKIEMNTIIQDYHNMIEELKNYDYSTVCQQIYDAQTIYLYGSGNEQKAIIEEFKRIFLIMGRLNLQKRILKKMMCLLSYRCQGRTRKYYVQCGWFLEQIFTHYL